MCTQREREKALPEYPLPYLLRPEAFYKPVYNRCRALMEAFWNLCRTLSETVLSPERSNPFGTLFQIMSVYIEPFRAYEIYRFKN